MKIVHYGMFLSLISHVVNAAVQVKVIEKEKLIPYAATMTQICCTVFKEYPYLYVGDFEEYFPIVERYGLSSHGIAAILFDQEKMVGVAVGSPLSEIREKYIKPFVATMEEKVDDIFYLGELVLLPEYRGKGYGKQLYAAFENMVKKSNYSTIAFCKIVEYEEHPCMPKDYYSLEKFWQKLNFVRTKLTFIAEWREVEKGQEELPHTMIFWKKNLLNP